MSIEKYINRLERMDRLIRMRATGNPIEFAKKMGMSRSLLMEYLKFLREKGATINYDRHDQTYVYERHLQFYCGYWSAENGEITQVSEPPIMYLRKIAC